MWINLLVILFTIALGVYYMQSENIVCVKIESGKDVSLIISRRKQYIILICIVLTLQSGLRNVAVGADTFQYFNIFESIKNLSWRDVFASFVSYYSLGEGKDPGYIVLQKIFQVFSTNYQFYLISIAVLFFSSLGYFIYKNTKLISDVLFAFVLYSVLFYSMFSITGIRQTIATALALWGYELVKRRKLLLYLLLIILASTIHKSVLILLPFYFCNRKGALKYIIGIFIVLLPLMFVYSSEISAFFMSFDTMYGQYEHLEHLKPYNFVILQFVLFFIGVYTFRTSFKLTANQTMVYWYSALLISIFFTTQVFQIHAFMRIIYYFAIFYLLLIPHMFRVIAYKTNLKYKYILIAVIIVLLLLYIKSSWGIEYRFFWQAMELGENYQ